MTESTINATDAAIRKAEAAGIPIEEVDGTGDDGKVTAPDVDAAIAARDEADAAPASKVEPVMQDRDHKRDCPADPNRQEVYDARKPIRTEDGAVLRYDTVPVAHCLDCGETVVLERGEE